MKRFSMLMRILGLIGLPLISSISFGQGNMTMNGSVEVANGKMCPVQHQNPTYSAFTIQNTGTDPLWLVGNQNSSQNGYRGIRIDQSGAVGIGELTNFNSLELFQVGNIEPLLIQDAGNGKRILFNMRCNYENFSWAEPYRYISNNQQASPAAMIYCDRNGDSLGFAVAPAAHADDITTNMIQGLSINCASANYQNNYSVDIHKVGNVGIKLPPYMNAQQALDVNGEIAFRDYNPLNPDPPTSAPTAGITLFCHPPDAENPHHYMMVHDLETDDYTQLNSHCDPTAYDPQAKCSFNDSQVTLPFSFRHENALIGKGQVVDMAKLVNWAEKKIKKELGDVDGKLVYDYNLDPKKTKTANDHEIDMVVAELASMPLIRVDVADNGQLPAEAVRAVDAYEQVPEKKTIKERKLDLASNRIVAVDKEITVMKRVKTGKKINQLRPGWHFKDGQLYREPTVADLDLNKFYKKHPGLPNWIKMRMKQGQIVSMNLSDLAAKLKSRQEAKAEQGSGNVNL